MWTNHAANHIVSTSQIGLTLADKSIGKPSLIVINNYHKDYGATGRVCNNFNVFTKFFKIKPINIKLPMGLLLLLTMLELFLLQKI